MMIEGEYNGAMCFGSLPQPNGGFPTIAANLKERSNRCSLLRPLVELLPLVIGEKPSHAVPRGFGWALGLGLGHDTLRLISL